MKRIERNTYNSLRKSITADTICVEIPTEYTHEGRQGIHEMLTIEKHMRASSILWNDIEKCYCIHYVSVVDEYTEEIRKQQEAQDIDQIMEMLPKSDMTWYGYEKPTEDTEETETTESDTKEEEHKTMKDEGIKIIDTGLDHIWGGCEFWNNTPRQIEKEGIKEPTSLDVMALRYAAMELLADDGDEDIFGTMNEVENASAICDQRLYVGNFDGYWLDDDHKLSYFYMHKENRVCAATYSESKDDFQYWLVY